MSQPKPCQQVLKDLGDRLTGKTVLMLREAVAKAEGRDEKSPSARKR